MKVKMKQYEWHLNTHRFDDWYLEARHKKPAWKISEKDYSLIDRIVLKLSEWYSSTVLDGLNWLSRYYLSLFGRVHVRIDYWDTWSADETLAHIIVPLLMKIKELKEGAPLVDNDDVPVELKGNGYDENGNVDENHFSRWGWVLDEMIWAFETILTDWESKYYHGSIDLVEKPTGPDGTWVETSYGENHTFTVDEVGLAQEQARINNGLRLFAKYYQNLWT